MQSCTALRSGGRQTGIRHGVRAEPARALHKSKAAGAGEGTGWGLTAARPPWSGGHTRAGLRQGASPAKCFRHPLGMCLQRAWEASHGHTPARQDAGGEPGQVARVRGGGASLTNPRWAGEDAGGREVIFSLDSCRLCLPQRCTATQMAEAGAIS